MGVEQNGGEGAVWWTDGLKPVNDLRGLSGSQSFRAWLWEKTRSLARHFDLWKMGTLHSGHYRDGMLQGLGN